MTDIVWHVIGDVQSNKTKFVAERAHWVHTVCRLKTAVRLSRQRRSLMPPLQVCVEVNIAGEAAKHGVAPEEAVALAVEVAKLPNLVVRGLMCVAKANSSETELKTQFQTMQSCLPTSMRLALRRTCCLWGCRTICLPPLSAVRHTSVSAARFSGKGADGNSGNKIYGNGCVVCIYGCRLPTGGWYECSSLSGWCKPRKPAAIDFGILAARVRCL